MEYSALKTIKKGIKYGIIFFIGVAISGFVGLYPEWAQMTVGALLTMFYDWLKHWAGFNIP